MKNFRIVTAMLIALVIVFNMFAPTMNVFAGEPDQSEKDQYGMVQINGATLESVNNATSVTATVTSGTNTIGTATITGTGLYSSGNIIYTKGDVEITATPSDNTQYTANITSGGDDKGVSTTITPVLPSVNTPNPGPTIVDIAFNPVQNEPPTGGNDPVNPPENNEQVSSMTFTLNGKNITADLTQSDPEVQVDQDMNFDELEEFYITEIKTNKKTYQYGTTHKYGINLKDSENRPILETNLTKQTSNLAYLRVQSHAGDIKNSDLTAMGKTSEDFCEFYIPQLKLIKPGKNGLVQLSTPHMPDVYDFVSFNGIELGDTSVNNFGKVSVYYGDDTVDLSGMGCDITNIELVEGMGVLKAAIDIDVENKRVKIKSNYYNEIPLKITAKINGEEVVVGYIKVSRVGIYINTVTKGFNIFQHGATNVNVNANGGNLNVDTDKYRIVAVFYHNNTETIDDYDIIVNIVNKDGTTETKLAKPVGDVNDNEGSLVGSDFILWEGDSIDKQPSKISATAVKKGATSNKTTFGGATFGAGAGVTWVNAK